MFLCIHSVFFTKMHWTYQTCIVYIGLRTSTQTFFYWCFATIYSASPPLALTALCSWHKCAHTCTSLCHDCRYKQLRDPAIKILVCSASSGPKLLNVFLNLKKKPMIFSQEDQQSESKRSFHCLGARVTKAHKHSQTLGIKEYSVTKLQMLCLSVAL